MAKNLKDMAANKEMPEAKKQKADLKRNKETDL